MITWVLLGGFVLPLLLGVPVGAALGIAVFSSVLLMPDLPANLFISGLVQGLNSLPLVSILLFTVSGHFMARGGISSRLVRLADLLFSRGTGGPAPAAVLACAFAATLSGTGAPAASAVMIPAMTKKGCDPHFSGALTATAGSIGVMIPPSVPMILYAVTAGIPIPSIFLAGVLPAAVATAALSVYGLLAVRKQEKPETTETDPSEQNPRIVPNDFWAVSVPVLILGGILGGLLTPSEAAAAAVIHSLVIGLLIYKELPLREVPKIIMESALSVSSVLMILGVSAGFSRVLAIEGIPIRIADFLLNLTESKVAVLLMLNPLLFVVGAVLDPLAAITILTPLLLPAAAEIGISPIHFGVMLSVNLAIGLITPPLGTNLFLTARTGRLSLNRLVRAVPPWIGVMILISLSVSFLPFLSEWLPSLRN